MQNELIRDSGDEAKRDIAEDIVSRLNPADVELWGFDRSRLLAPLEQALGAGERPVYRKPRLSNFTFQRRVLLALKKDIHERPHGKLVKRLRYYCDVLLRE